MPTRFVPASNLCRVIYRRIVNVCFNHHPIHRTALAAAGYLSTRWAETDARRRQGERINPPHIPCWWNGNTTQEQQDAGESKWKLGSSLIFFRLAPNHRRLEIKHKQTRMLMGKPQKIKSKTIPTGTALDGEEIGIEIHRNTSPNHQTDWSKSCDRKRIEDLIAIWVKRDNRSQYHFGATGKKFQRFFVFLRGWKMQCHVGCPSNQNGQAK